MKTVVGKVASKDVQFTGNDPPSVAQGRFTTGRQEDLELTGIKRERRNSWTFPRPQATKRAVGDLMRKIMLKEHILNMHFLSFSSNFNHTILTIFILLIN